MSIFLTIFGVLVGIATLSSIAEGSKRSAYRKKIEGIIHEIANEHQVALAKNRTKKLKIDDYGDVVSRPWEAEVKRFYTNKVGPYIPISGMKPDEVISQDEIFSIIDSIAEAGQSDLVNGTSTPVSNQHFDDTMSGIDYEHYCAKILRQAGWTAQVSQSTGDQGVDILATTGDTRVAIQCKRYNNAIGNKAVQEVIAGKSFYEADYGVVVTSSTFTPSAYDLAEKTKIVLIHHSDLSNLADRFGIEVQNELPEIPPMQAERSDAEISSYRNLAKAELKCPKLSLLDYLVRILFGCASLGVTEVLLYLYRKLTNETTGARASLVAYIVMVGSVGLLLSYFAPENPNAQEIGQLLTELKSIPVREYDENLVRYSRLVELDPDEPTYEAKRDFYSYMQASEQRVSRLEGEEKERALELLMELRGIPVAEVEENIERYEELVLMDPANEYFMSKLDQYLSMLEENEDQ